MFTVAPGLRPTLVTLDEHPPEQDRSGLRSRLWLAHDGGGRKRSFCFRLHVALAGGPYIALTETQVRAILALAGARAPADLGDPAPEVRSELEHRATVDRALRERRPVSVR